MSKPFHPASNFCPSITNASKPPGFADFTNFSTASFFRLLLRQADAPITEQLLANSFASLSPSRCSLCRATAFKSLFPLRSCRASFAHNYSSPINRFFIAPNSLDLSRTIVASDSIDSSLSFVFTQAKFDSAEFIFAFNFRFFFRRSLLTCPAASKSLQRTHHLRGCPPHNKFSHTFGNPPRACRVRCVPCCAP